MQPSTCDRYLDFNSTSYAICLQNIIERFFRYSISIIHQLNISTILSKTMDFSSKLTISIQIVSANRNYEEFVTNPSQQFIQIRSNPLFPLSGEQDRLLVTIIEYASNCDWFPIDPIARNYSTTIMGWDLTATRIEKKSLYPFFDWFSYFFLDR